MPTAHRNPKALPTNLLLVADPACAGTALAGITYGETSREYPPPERAHVPTDSISGLPTGIAVSSLHVRPAKERFGTAKDGFLFRDGRCARRARLGPVLCVRRSRRHARLDPRRYSPVQDAARPRHVLVSGDTGGPHGAPHPPGPRGALPVAATSRQRPGRDGGRRPGGDHTLLDDRLAGDVPGRARAGLRRRGSTQDRRLRKRGPHGDPAVPQGARGFAREDKGSPASGA